MNRKEAPVYVQPDQLKLIFPEKVELSNGVKLFWLKEFKDESVKLDIEWNAGSKYQSSNLVASFTNRLFLSGTKDFSSKKIAEKVDFYGGFVSQENDKDHAGLTIYGLNENIEKIFDVVDDAMKNCIFPKDEFEKEKNIGLNKFKIDSEKVKVLCQREFNRLIFGEKTAYGQVADVGSFEKLNREEIIQFYRDFYYNQKPVLFLVGNVSDSFINRLKKWSDSFKGEKHTELDMSFVQQKGKIRIEKKEALQSAIRIGRLFIDKKHPDYFHFQVLNTVLGGYFGSKLMANIREDKGYTYGIGSGVVVLESASYFFITTEVAKEVTDATIKEIFYELDLLKTELISIEELDRVKNYLLGEFLRNSDGLIAMMENFKNIYFNDLSESYYTDFINAIHDLKPKRLMELANKYFQRDEMLEVIVG